MTTPPKPASSGPVQLEINLGNRLEVAMKRLGETIHQRSQQRKAQQQAIEPLQTIPDQQESQAPLNAAPPVAPQRQQASSNVTLLTPWADDKRAAPNAVFRSALFPALNNKQGRRYVENQKIYSVGGLEVTFTGKQFDQTDLDVYLEILNFAKGIPLGQPVRFSAYAMLRALGWATGGKDHKRLHSHLVRLCGGVVDATDHKTRYFGQLLFGGIRDEITRDYEITLNPNYAALFGFGLWSAIDLEQRRALSRNSTAKALHAYYSTHAAPSLHHYETLAGIVGLEGKNKTAVKNSLINAHEELKHIGFLLDYEAKATGIEVKATMTPGQQQHVIKKIVRTPRRKNRHGQLDDQNPKR